MSATGASGLTGVAVRRRPRGAGDVALPIPLNDLGYQHAQIEDEVRRGWAQLCHSGQFVLGEQLEQFESEFAAYCGRRHCVGVGNGTDAIELALRAAGVGPGDAVAVPANSFSASAFAVLRAGADVAFVDVGADTALADVAQLRTAALEGVRCLLPVHLYGQLCPLEQLGESSAGQAPLVIEDAAQSHGATRYGRTAGSFGVAAAVSFHPSKNLGAYGDAGAVLTDSEVLAERVRTLRSHGARTRYVHEEVGPNSRLDELQAVVLRAKLRRLDEWNAQRRRAAERYDELLADLDEVETPATEPGNAHVWHLYVIQVPRRDEVLRRLHRGGVMAGMHYPTPIHLQRPFALRGHSPGEAPRAERRARRLLSLPVFPGISEAQQARVVAELRAALAATAGCAPDR